MKKKLLGKRIVTFVLALAVLFTTCVPPQEVKADTTLPTATNTTIAKSRTLTFDSSIAENMSDSDNLRYYKFTLSGASELIVRGSTGFRVDVTVYDADQTAVYSEACYYNFSKSSVTKKNVASNKTSATYTNLKKNKTYYVRMRSYVKVDGKKVYSSWSVVKNIKIKK